MLSKTCEYALRAMIYIAQQSKDGHMVNIKEVSEKINSPELFIAKILQSLSKKGYLQSSKGRYGGFCISDKEAEFSLAEIHLDTGRHHQIRVQMAHLGCPIAGDRKYDPNQTSFSQLQLFACRLEFAHPKTKKHMEFTHAPVLRVFADETPADHPVG